MSSGEVLWYPNLCAVHGPGPEPDDATLGGGGRQAGVPVETVHLTRCQVARCREVRWTGERSQVSGVRCQVLDLDG